MVAPLLGVSGLSGTISSVEPAPVAGLKPVSPVRWARAAKSVPKTSGRRKPMVALVALSTVTSSTITLAGVMVAGLIGAENRAVIGELVEKPSSLLMLARLGKPALTAAGTLSVPSVLPLK